MLADAVRYGLQGLIIIIMCMLAHTYNMENHAGGQASYAYTSNQAPLVTVTVNWVSKEQ
jgi:hypothetical protein